MWSANLDKVNKQGDNVVATVTFTSDSNEVITQDIPGNDLTPDTLGVFVGNKIQALEERDLALQTFVVGPIVAPQKTTDQQAKLDALTTLIAQTVAAQPVTTPPTLQ